LAVQNPKLSVCGRKLSEPFQKNQRVNPSLFLILKKGLRPPPPERVPKAQATAGGLSRPPLRTNFLFQIKIMAAAQAALATYGALFKARLQGG
jgi:hypothetical protein